MVANRDLRRKEPLERVAERSDLPKSKVTPVIEAALAVMGEALSEDRGLALQPPGRVKLQRAKDLPDGRIMVLKLRRKSATPDSGA